MLHRKIAAEAWLKEKASNEVVDEEHPVTFITSAMTYMTELRQFAAKKLEEYPGSPKVPGRFQLDWVLAEWEKECHKSK